MEQVPVCEVSKAVRYLGIWLDADMQSKEGREKLERKLHNKMVRLEALQCNPMTKVMLLKGSVVSLVNYTAGLQDLGLEWCEDLDKQLYRVITRGRGGMQMCRRDLTYQDVVHGGLA